MQVKRMLDGCLRHRENKMKIITWNMHYCNYYAFKSKELHEYHYVNHLSAWEFMVERVQPDIALLQEVNPVRKYSDNLIYQKSHTSEDEIFGSLGKDEMLAYVDGSYDNEIKYFSSC